MVRYMRHDIIQLSHLDLYIKQSTRVHFNTKVNIDVVCKALLVGLLDGKPLLLELLVVDKLQETFQLVQVSQPLLLGDLECLSNELAKLRVALGCTSSEQAHNLVDVNLPDQAIDGG